MEEYGLIIIGGGPAGYFAAERAAEAGIKTLLVEKREVGGTCLNEGCIPTKVFMHAAKSFYCLNHKLDQFGIKCENPKLIHTGVLNRKNEVVYTLVNGVKQSLKRRGVKIVGADAGLLRKDGSLAVSCGNTEFKTKKILIATGSVPVIPNIAGLDEALKNGNAVTSREILDLYDVPEELVIIGAGVVGLEMAAYFHEAGSKVTVVEMLDHIGGELDQDVSKQLQQNMESKGIRFCLGSQVVKAVKGEITLKQNGEPITVPYGKLLICTGRRPASDISGIKEMGVLIQNHAVVTDEQCRTNIAGIYAAGDVNGKYMLAHAAYREALAAVNSMIGHEDAVDYSAIPGVIYTDPEVAFVGMTERQAKSEGIDYTIKKVPAGMSGRYVAENGLDGGFCKLIIDRKKDILLGAAIISTYASEIIYAITLMIQNKMPVDSIKRTIFPHPTVCELIREAIFI